MKRVIKLFIISIFVVVSAFSQALPQSYPDVNITGILSKLTVGDRWIKHLNDDLLPFWTTKDALAGGSGDFPTYRCDDGTLFNPATPCKEIEKANRCCQCGLPGMPDCAEDCTMSTEGGSSFKDKIGCLVNTSREYVRAKSRQVFAYGIAYHLTGKEEYLKYAYEGMDFLRKHAFDRINGGVINFWQIDSKTGEKKLAPEVDERISQDMAYALSGIGFYYYLTHDSKVLKDVVKIKDYIFSTYYDKALDLLKWVNKDWKDMGSLQSIHQKELVSQLDQVYGYMIWLTGALPEKLQKSWKKDLTHLAHLMIEQFFSEKYGLFWGAVSSTEDKQLGKPHTDFGHSIKTLWLIYTIGKMTNQIDLIKFAEPRALAIIERAYLPDGTWGRGYKLDKDGNEWVIDHDKEWWALAELDQTTATLALINPSLASKLTTTYPYWFEHMVDKEHGGVWHMVFADGKIDYDFPKQHSWKNAFHTFEHALVSYITSQALHGEPVTLYFAYHEKPKVNRVHPYIYFGKIKSMTQDSFKDKLFKHYKKIKVEFTDIR